MKKLDWTYITRDRAKENINAIAIETIKDIVSKQRSEDIAAMTRGVLMLMEDFIKSLELPEDEDDE